LDQQQRGPQNEIAYQHKAEDARAEGTQQHDWRKTIEKECSPSHAKFFLFWCAKYLSDYASRLR
jgi:hypothetical protein